MRRLPRRNRRHFAGCQVLSLRISRGVLRAPPPTPPGRSGTRVGTRGRPATNVRGQPDAQRAHSEGCPALARGRLAMCLTETRQNLKANRGRRDPVVGISFFFTDIDFHEKVKFLKLNFFYTFDKLQIRIMNYGQDA